MSTYFIHVHLAHKSAAIVIALPHVGGPGQAAQFVTKVSESLDAGESLILDHAGEVFVVPADSVLFVRVTTDDEPVELDGA